MPIHSAFPRRILVIAAHPDDIEILCAGTMARYAQLGCEVMLCNATTGDRGGMLGTMEELARVRDAEAHRSAALMGARYICLGFHDCTLIPEDLATRQKFIDVIRQTKPDIVFTHHPNDYHADHISTGKLALDASFMASIPLLESSLPATDAILPLYYMDTMAGQDFLPEEYVDVSCVMDLKRQMLEQHQSQITWMRDHDDLDLIDFMMTMGKFRGIQCGVGFAEAFRRAPNWLRQTPSRLLP